MWTFFALFFGLYAFIGAILILGLFWALFCGNITDKWNRDKWVFRVIYILSLLVGIYVFMILR